MKFVIFFISNLLAAAYGTPWIPEPKYGDIHFTLMHNIYVNYTRDSGPNVNVLFYGDSITQFWYLNGKAVFQEYYADLGTANYGIAGDRTEQLLWRMRDGELTDRLSPKVCVIKVGTNNIPELNDAASIATGIIMNVLELRDKLPNTKVLLLGVLPRESQAITEITNNINEIIKHLDNGNTIRFLDMRDHFYRGGDDFVSELFIDDLLHLSEAGYRKWAEVMDPLFKEMLHS